MPRLASISSFETFYGVSASALVKPKIGRALDLATMFIQETLNTDFTEATHTDYFVVKPYHVRIPDDLIMLRLSNGFVSDSPALEVSTRYSRSDEFVLEESEVYVLDAEKGLCKLYEDLLGGDRLRVFGLTSAINDTRSIELKVVYNAGFTETEDAVGEYYLGVPKYLKEVCISQALEVYDQIQESKDIKFTAIREAHALDRYRRFNAAQVVPYHTQ